MRSDEVAVVVGRGDVVRTMGEVSSCCLSVMLSELTSCKRSVVTCSLS